MDLLICSFQTILALFGLFVQACLTEITDNTKHDYKKVSKREYYAPEYNHEQYVSKIIKISTFKKIIISYY